MTKDRKIPKYGLIRLATVEPNIDDAGGRVVPGGDESNRAEYDHLKTGKRNFTADRLEQGHATTKRSEPG